MMFRSSPALPLWLLVIASIFFQSHSSFINCLNSSSDDKFFYTPNDANFTSVLQTYIRNLQFTQQSTPKPKAIVTPLTPAHVQAAILCAKKNSVQLRIRSGGHDYDGLSYVSNVKFAILDMFNFRDIKIDIDTESAWVEAGAMTGELYYAIAQQSKVHAFPAGVCFTLGTGGHFSGGGYGNLMRKYGLSIDNIVDAVIVDVNGRVLDRKGMGEDLFWAIRGGGAASFGVVISWKINLVRVPETTTVFKVIKTLDQGAVDALDQWQHLAANDTLERDIFIRVMLDVKNGTVAVSFIGMYLGDGASLVQTLSNKFPLLGLKKEDCIETSWLKTTMFWYGIPLNASTDVFLQRVPAFSSYLKRKSDYVQQVIPRTGLEAIMKKLIELGGKVGMAFNPYGGRMAEISASETPFPHRAGNLWKIQYTADWKNVTEGDAYMNAIRDSYAFMAPYVSNSPREAFLNYRDVDIGTNDEGHKDFGYKYFKSNFDRLMRIKSAVDPCNFFKNEQSIPASSN